MRGSLSVAVALIGVLELLSFPRSSSFPHRRCSTLSFKDEPQTYIPTSRPHYPSTLKYARLFPESHDKGIGKQIIEKKKSLTTSTDKRVIKGLNTNDQPTRDRSVSLITNVLSVMRRRSRLTHRNTALLLNPTQTQGEGKYRGGGE